MAGKMKFENFENQKCVYRKALNLCIDFLKKIYFYLFFVLKIVDLKIDCKEKLKSKKICVEFPNTIHCLEQRIGCIKILCDFYDRHNFLKNNPISKAEQV